MQTKTIKDEIDFNNVYFGFEIGQNYDYKNGDYYTFADIVILEKTSYTKEQDNDITNIYVDLLTNKLYFLNSKNKVLNNDNSNIINNYIEDIISVTDLFEEYKSINNSTYNDLINKFEGNSIISRKLFFENINKIINIKDYVDKYKEEKTSSKVKVKTMN